MYIFVEQIYTHMSLSSIFVKITHTCKNLIYIVLFHRQIEFYVSVFFFARLDGPLYRSIGSVITNLSNNHIRLFTFLRSIYNCLVMNKQISNV